MHAKWMGSMVLGLLLVIPACPRQGAAARTPKEQPAPPEEAAKAVDATPAKTEAAKVEAPAAREASPVEMELQQLKDLILEQSRELEAQRVALREQQKRMERLETQLHAVRLNPAPASEPANPGAAPAFGSPAPNVAPAVATLAASQQELDQKVSRLEKDLTETRKKALSFGPFQFSGDLRVRYEPFFGGGVETSPTPESRHRERFRLRINARAKFNDEFSGGFRLTTGDTGDPTSTNQTLTEFFTRKPINIDQAFLNYHPRWFRPLQITVGKFAYTWYRTELTWDNDLNAEGMSQALQWDRKDSFLQHFGVVAFQMPVFEVSKGPDTGIFGGQLQTAFRLNDRLKLSAYGSFYHYRNADAIANNQNGGPGAIGAGFGNTGFGGNITNFFGQINGRNVFASKFDVLDAIARLDVKTGLERFPLMLQLDFAQNTQACSNLDKFIAAGVTPPFCDPKQRHAYWAEAQFGQTRNPGDFVLGYTFMRIERDAVVSAFNFSDLRQATNDVNHRLVFAYQAYRNIQLGLTALFGRQLQTADSAASSVPKERILKRFQFDVIYKF